MSSNIRVVKICDFCKNEFIARKTTSKTCSDRCASRFYKEKIRNGKVAAEELKTEIQRRPKAFISLDELTVIQNKENLTLKEAALLLNITPLTLRRWVFAGKINSTKIGKKWKFKKSSLRV